MANPLTVNPSENSAKQPGKRPLIRIDILWGRVWANGGSMLERNKKSPTESKGTLTGLKWTSSTGRSDRCETETEQKSETKTQRSVAYFREKKERIFDDLAGPVKKMAIPQHDPRYKITKLHNRGHKIPRPFTQADESNNRVLTFMTKLAMLAIFAWLLIFFLTSLVRMAVAACANLHKRPAALVRYYVTLHWHAECLKKRGWKNQIVISFLPPPQGLILYVLTCLKRIILKLVPKALLTVWLDIFATVCFCRLAIFCVLRELIFAIRTDWIFLNV